MIRASYEKGSYGDLEVEWLFNGVRVDDLADRELSLIVYPYGGATVFTKTAGFTVPALVDGEAPNPNLVVAWSQVANQELDALDPDVEYFMEFAAAGEDDQRKIIGSIIVRQNSPSLGYCEITDLLLGDLTVSASVNKYSYINSAAGEMDGVIGQRYRLPLDLDAAPDWVALKLKTINQNLATGRLIQALAIAGQDASVNKYGQSLIDSAMSDLEAIQCGTTTFPGLVLEPTSFQTTAPSITNRDEFSAVDSFEDYFMRGSACRSRPAWQPGPA